ncbi:MAG: hypothetical protein R3B84_17745 [Zavarzinella sp.]
MHTAYILISLGANFIFNVQADLDPKAALDSLLEAWKEQVYPLKACSFDKRVTIHNSMQEVGLVANSHSKLKYSEQHGFVDEAIIDITQKTYKGSLILPHESYCLGKNTQYGFRLAYQNNGWLLMNDNKQKPFVNTPESLLAYKRQCLPGSPFSLPYFACINLDLSLRYPNKALKKQSGELEFTYETIANDSRATIIVLVDPMQIKVLSINAQTTATNTGERRSNRVEFQYSSSNQENLPVCTGVKGELLTKDKNNITLSSEITEIFYGNVQLNKSIPAEVFRLSHYDLPEPEGIIWEKPIPVWQWIILGVVTCSIIAIILQLFARRFAGKRNLSSSS